MLGQGAGAIGSGVRVAGQDPYDASMVPLKASDSGTYVLESEVGT